MTDPTYFDELYRDDPDPWRLATSPYERRKRALTITSLPRERYRRAFEPGCATGHLTVMLSAYCDEVIAVDTAQAAVDRVEALALDNVTASIGSIPATWPSGPIDLVVLSEVLYYLDPVSRARTAELARSTLSPDGHVIAVHWRHAFDESASPPSAAHADLHAVGLRRVVEHLEEDFTLEVFGRG